MLSKINVYKIIKYLLFVILLKTSTVFALGGGGELVIVANQEPQSMASSKAYKEVNAIGIRNIIEFLTRLDNETGEVKGQLATSWEQVSPTTMHFKLREGINFHDGTPMNAEAVAVSLNWLYDPENKFDILEMMGPQITAEVVNEYTVAVNTEAPDPMLAKRLYMAGITSAKQIQERPDEHYTIPIGTGPYVFEEWKNGEYYTANKNPDWRGIDDPDTYGKIFYDSVRVIWRAEPLVRSAVVESGEGHVGMFVTAEECDRLKSAGGVTCIAEASDTFLQYRLDYDDRDGGTHPLLMDPNFRKAIFTGIDWNGIQSAFMGLGSPVQGQSLPSTAIGFNDTLSQYPFDPEGAKAIVESYKGKGLETLTLHSSTRVGSTARNGEMVEAIGAMLSYIGINNTVAVEEPGVFNPRAVAKPTDERSYAWLHVRNNPLMDFGADLKSHTGCDGVISVYCNPEYETRLDQALTLSGSERHEALKVLVKETHDLYVIGTVGLLQRAYAVPEGFNWSFGPDHRMIAVNMSD